MAVGYLMGQPTNGKENPPSLCEMHNGVGGVAYVWGQIIHTHVCGSMKNVCID